jgi:hypothetical protein
MSSKLGSILEARVRRLCANGTRSRQAERYIPEPLTPPGHLFATLLPDEPVDADGSQHVLQRMLADILEQKVLGYPRH